LEQRQADHEGFSAGSLAALKQSQHVLGSLADRFVFRTSLFTAIETALGHHLQLVLTEHPEAAQEILADLSTNKKGRASIAPLSLGNNGGASTQTSQSNGDVSAPYRNGAPLEAIKVVESDSIRASAFGSGCLARLEWFAICLPRLPRGARAPARSITSLSLVNCSAATAFITGGYNNANGNGKAPASILGRKNQIGDLRSALAKLQEEVAELSRRKGALQSEQTELQASCSKRRPNSAPRKSPSLLTRANSTRCRIRKRLPPSEN